MAAPFRWFDDLATLGWLRVLSGAAVRLLWAIGRFYFAKGEHAKADAVMLQRVSGLSRSGFYEARVELQEAGLIEVALGTRTGLYRDYRTHIYRLVSPVPPVPANLASTKADGYSPRQDASSPPRQTKPSTRAEISVRHSGQINGANPYRRRLSALGSTTAKTQLGQVVEGTGSEALKPVILSRLFRATPEAVGLVGFWAAAVRRSPSSRERVIGDAVAAIRGRFPDLPTVGVREAVEDAAAISNPVVQQAVALFDGHGIEVKGAEA